MEQDKLQTIGLAIDKVFVTEEVRYRLMTERIGQIRNERERNSALRGAELRITIVREMRAKMIKGLRDAALDTGFLNEEDD